MEGVAREMSVAQAGEDGVLLREASHRAGNDLAVALAGLRMAFATDGIDAARRGLLGDAMARVEVSAELHRILARPLPDRVDAADWLRGICDALGGRPEGPSRVSADLTELWCDGAAARRLVMIAAELVSNALRHGVRSGRGAVAVSLRGGAACSTLLVSDDGPGIRPGQTRPGGGLGSGIVADLVRLGGGRMSVDTGSLGTTVEVTLPRGSVRSPARRSSEGDGA